MAILAVILTHAYSHNGTRFLARVLNSCAGVRLGGRHALLCAVRIPDHRHFARCEGQAGVVPQFYSSAHTAYFPALLRVPGGLLVPGATVGMGRVPTAGAGQHGRPVLLALPREHAGMDHGAGCLIPGVGPTVVARGRGTGLPRLAVGGRAAAVAHTAAFVQRDHLPFVRVEGWYDAPEAVDRDSGTPGRLPV